MDDYIELHGQAIKDWAKPQTNGDRLRAMTDEELADFQDSIGYCPPIHNRSEHCIKHKDESCSACWLDWLQSPADGGDGDAQTV